VDAKGRSAEAVTRYDYDSFGRLRAVASPGDTLDSPTESYEYVLASPISRIVKRGRSKIAGESDLAEVQCFDGQGRKIQTRVLIENDRFQVSGYAALNSLGKDARTYQPHKSLGEACATAEPHGVLAVSTRYDSRGRPLEVTKPDVAVYGSASTTRTDYAPLRSKAWDEEDTDDTSHHRATPITTWTDGLGRTVRVDREIVSAEPISTHFTYDDLSNLRGYVDAKGNEKVQVYDLVGRVLDVRDPDAGHLQYRHDPVGNRLSATDGRGERTEFTFDEANRPLAHWAASDPMHTLVSTRYDDINECSACEFVAGRLSEVTYPMADEGGGRDRFGYDIRGESAYLSRDLDEHRFEVRHSYDNAGRLVSLQSSLGIDFEYSHDGAGRVVSVAGYVNDLRYDDRGMPDTIEFANGVSTTYGYDALGRLALID
jgi:YD repeat-containing protein